MRSWEVGDIDMLPESNKSTERSSRLACTQRRRQLEAFSAASARRQTHRATPSRPSKGRTPALAEACAGRCSQAVSQIAKSNNGRQTNNKFKLEFRQPKLSFSRLPIYNIESVPKTTVSTILVPKTTVAYLETTEAIVIYRSYRNLQFKYPIIYSSDIII